MYMEESQKVIENLWNIMWSRSCHKILDKTLGEFINESGIDHGRVA